jgi:hypothetical protein
MKGSSPMMSILRTRSKSSIVLCATFLGGIALGSRPADAQNPHPDVAPRVQNGQVVTGGIDDTNNAFTPNLRVFDFVFGQDDPTQPYFDSDPGWRAEPEPGFPSTGFTPGKHLHFDILSGAPYGLPANLTYWNGTGSPHFGMVPNGETLRLDLAGGLADATAGSGNAFIPGFDIGTLDSTGDLHIHLSSFIQGSGGNNPANGIYMMVLDPSTDMPGIAAAKPIFVLWDNGLGDGPQLAAAVNFAQATFVPEPSSLALVCIGSVGVGLAVWRARRRRCRCSRGS